MQHLLHDIEVTLDELEVPFTKGGCSETGLVSQQFLAKIDELDRVDRRDKAR